MSLGKHFKARHWPFMYARLKSGSTRISGKRETFKYFRSIIKLCVDDVYNFRNIIHTIVLTKHRLNITIHAMLNLAETINTYVMNTKLLG